MKHFICLLAIFLLGSCTYTSFEKEYYERISEVRFPDHFTLVESIDNGEFITLAVLVLAEKGNHFVRQYPFKPLSSGWVPPLGLAYLSPSLRQLPDITKMLEYAGSTKQNSWRYLIDTTTGRLYCEIQYPDMSGDKS
jgi:hypothetical protein